MLLKPDAQNFLIISTSSEYGYKSTQIKKIGTKLQRKPKDHYSISKAKFTDLIKKLSKKKSLENADLGL